MNTFSPIQSPVPRPRTQPRISAAARDMIIRHESGGRAYYERVVGCHPHWPGGNSGITIGFGYDLGQVTPRQFRSDWQAALSVPSLLALEPCVGVRTDHMRELLASVAYLRIPWDAAERVFSATMLPYWEAVTNDALVNCHLLPADCFGALVSLTMNRGPNYWRDGPRYAEMRVIAGDMRRGDLSDIPSLIRSMTRLWKGLPVEAELTRRRNDEAALFERGLTASRTTNV